MNAIARYAIALVTAAMVFAQPSLTEVAAKDQELFNQGKLLMFDKKWDEARAVFERMVQEHAKSSLAPQAHYFKARCLHMQGKETAALQAFELFLQKFPSEPFLPQEARNAIVDLAVAMAEKGDGQFKDRIISGLSDSQKEVRYFTAIRCSYLSDSKIKSLAVPVLKQIIDSEKERDLVDRAKIALLRLEPEALGRKPEAGKPEEKSQSRMFHIVVYEEGEKEPKVELKLPVSFAELAISALSSAKREELKRKGFDIENVFESLKRMGRTEILTLRDGRETVKIWIE